MPMIKAFSKRTRSTLFATASMLCMASGASASVVAVFTERSSDVLIEVSGSIDTAAFSGFSSLTDNFVLGTSVSGSSFRVAPITNPNGNSTTYFLDNFYVSFASMFTSGTFIVGDIIVVADNGGSDQLRLDAGYVSGSPLLSSGTLPGNFTSLGLNTASPVVMNLPGSQTVTVQFVPIPEPSSLLLSVLGAGCLMARRRKPVTCPSA